MNDCRRTLSNFIVGAIIAVSLALPPRANAVLGPFIQCAEYLSKKAESHQIELAALAMKALEIHLIPSFTVRYRMAESPAIAARAQRYYSKVMLHASDFHRAISDFDPKFRFLARSTIYFIVHVLVNINALPADEDAVEFIWLFSSYAGSKSFEIDPKELEEERKFFSTGETFEQWRRSQVFLFTTRYWSQVGAALDTLESQLEEADSRTLRQILEAEEVALQRPTQDRTANPSVIDQLLFLRSQQENFTWSTIPRILKLLQGSFRQMTIREDSRGQAITSALQKIDRALTAP